jgi:hypothetical protein
LHRHTEEDELFYVLSGTAEFRCDNESFPAGPGDFVLLPAGMAHTFIVGADENLRSLQITTPAGFEHFAAEAGGPAQARRLPDPGPADPVALGHAAARHGIEILGPPRTIDPAMPPAPVADALRVRIWSSSTSMGISLSPRGAGPWINDPSMSTNLEPCTLQVMTPSLGGLTMAARCGHRASNALNSPGKGWTMSMPDTTLPPPTGTASVAINIRGAAVLAVCSAVGAVPEVGLTPVVG